MAPIKLHNHWLKLDEFESLVRGQNTIELSEECIDCIQKSWSFLHSHLVQNKEPIYGVNTGFGSLCSTSISHEEAEELQFNLLRSHACGMGERVPNQLVKRMLLLKILALSKGFSGVQLATVERLIFFYNHSIFPVVYQQGSLGASGDLAPLAHLCLPMIGEGQVEMNGELMEAQDCLNRHGLSPISLQAKEALALTNGTQFMGAYATYCVSTAQGLSKVGLKIAAMSLDAFDGMTSPFNAQLNAIRQQKGQIEVSSDMLELLKQSEIACQAKTYVQDPYSFRCIPQVHGASLDTINYASQIIENEINAVTDNPVILSETKEIVSGGNFHGQPLALVMDYLAIALSELGSISERRVYKLISGVRGLPPFLTAKSGLHSGFMIVQYACASIVSQNKQWCTPASIDSIDSSLGQEDHVSMGANSGTKLFKIVENVMSIVGIELFTAAQALDYRRPLKSSALIEEMHSDYRKWIQFIDKDVIMSKHMKDSAEWVRQNIEKHYQR